MTTLNKIKSMYIHIPFCKSICSYCDFCKFFYNEDIVNKYLNSLIKEINKRYNNEILSTIYIGGGTPSCLNIKQLDILFKKINEIKLEDDYEFTFEFNIMDITKEKLEYLKNNRVNRISIGIESFQDRILKILERNYTEIDILEKVNLAKEYFNNINIDLIYAVSSETLEELKKDLDMFLKLDVNHISTYSLIIENNTKLGINKVKEIDDNLDLEMYNYIRKTLKDNGYNHYEISNFSKDNSYSKHNMCYWENKRYYGFGLGASGYIENIRYTNTKNINKYLKEDYIYEKEEMNLKLDSSNCAILGLRTINGIDNDLFKEKYKEDFINYFKVEDLINDNILIKDKNKIFINPDYWYVSNSILVRFI